MVGKRCRCTHGPDGGGGSEDQGSWLAAKKRCPYRRHSNGYIESANSLFRGVDQTLKGGTSGGIERAAYFDQLSLTGELSGLDEMCHLADASACHNF